ncbi:MAG: hypothetical protein A2315_06535 [Ignavibacteria bacterium RIFOXYB2_FULL_35_12]|nr:MAG: hypothetical protein A2058_01755 [Ignavibacteria bacterium GWA2_36_19]OGU58791.1 MAG: hypothetical protein A2X60_11285 [Ignavibacteria bacterium GWF2_35_20]OGU78150.1 MAG: hypothetical protein A2254_10065 [Ignavibacteria bacterium RIFOXYA2_FULL_35_9]OGU91339.1 MAG: hypothetical protein A3K31_08285 [Ignavibacteria bacterium RIFOXYA12_FULL_35_25]OGU94418.1 MAG: hypothetical protein A2347_13510 [Ignavibacteria bacterium RIFOXYB12_FULL_35_14]OGU98391.1 MAG: hypothetical protein A2455_01215
MKKLFIFLVVLVAAYLVYDNFVKEKEVIHVEGSLVRVQESASLEAPGVSARNYGHAEGTTKNMTDKVVKNIVINYMIDRQISSTTIAQLNPNEEVRFKTNQVMIRVMEPPFYLESVKFEE